MESKLLNAFRTETEELHKRVERTTEMASLMSPRLTSEEYLSILRKQREFYRAFEPELTRLINGKYDYESKLPWLDEDLKDDDGTFELKDGLSLEDFDEAVGALYVIEGSMLGGQVITRNLRKVLPEHQHRFFSGNGPKTREKWLSFIEFVTQTEDSIDQEKAVDGAIRTFSLIERVFSTS